jgi:hypothetical protein
MIDDGDCWATGGMKIGRGNRSTRKKPAPVPFCPPQILHDQTRAWIRAAELGKQRLTAWAMLRSYSHATGSSQLAPSLVTETYRETDCICKNRACVTVRSDLLTYKQAYTSRMRHVTLLTLCSDYISQPISSTFNAHVCTLTSLLR